eukprot:Skav228724  [mRNA]  locus=scaffold1830:269748:271832:- [translate_table: standard]
MLSSHVTDPEIFLLENIIKAARVLLYVLDPARRTMFLNIAAAHSTDPLKVRGPAGNLAYSLAQIGWQIDPHGRLLTDTPVEFNLFEAPWPSIRAFLRKQFIQHFLQAAVIKPELRYQPLPDVKHTLQVLLEFEPKDQQILAYHLTGANMLASQTRHFTLSEGRCPLCQQPDSNEHRLLRCPSLAHVRARHQLAIDFLEEHDPCHIHLPVIAENPLWQFEWLIAQNIPPPDINESALQHITDMLEAGQDLRFYTDGSADPSNFPEGSRAAYSVVLHTSTTEQDIAADLAAFAATRTIPAAYQTVAVGYCQGAQTIQRAELLAVLVPVELDIACHIHTDSQYVVDWAQRLGYLLDLLKILNAANFDLLRRFWTALQTGQVTLHKVKAHAIDLQRDPPQVSLHKIGNEAADLAAKVAQKRFAATVPPTRTRDQVDVTDFFVIDFPADLERTLSCCLYGTRYSLSICRWMQMIQWSTAEPTPQDPGVSWIELAISFMLTTQQGIVINSQIDDKQKFVAKQLPLHDTTVPFTAKSFSFERAISQIFQLLRRKLPAWRRHSSATQVYGSQYGRAGLAPRPVFPHHSVVVQLMTNLMMTEEQCLNDIVIPDQTPDFIIAEQPDDASDLATGWESRRSKFRKFKKSFRGAV